MLTFAYVKEKYIICHIKMAGAKITLAIATQNINLERRFASST